MSQDYRVDHITICVRDLKQAEYLFTEVLGFKVIWSAEDIGTEKSSMDTIVVQRGDVKIALMQGRDKEVKSQINDFIDRYGEGVQHIAIEVDDIEAACRELESKGVKFSGPLKIGRDSFGPLKQRFTFPLFKHGGLFIELTQRKHGQEAARTFVPETVESLYREIEQEQLAGRHQTIIDYDKVPHVR